MEAIAQQAPVLFIAVLLGVTLGNPAVLPQAFPGQPIGNTINNHIVNKGPEDRGVGGGSNVNRVPLLNAPAPAGRNTGELLSKNPICEVDIARLCDKSIHLNNLAVLDCVQNSKRTEETDITGECQHLLWGYKHNLTKDDRFTDATKQVCGEEIDKLPDCQPSKNEETGHLLSCLISIQENVTKSSCKQFLTKMESIIFSDYRFIHRFTKDCERDIEHFHCGRLDREENNSPHSQGFTIECLSKNPHELAEECRHEILRIAEIQSEDYHLDRPLFFACRDDRERFCEKTEAGDGRVYRCLYRHKMDPEMSRECQEKLSRRQALVAMDYKASHSLSKACREDIRAHKCREETAKNRELRLAQILLCLENKLHLGFTVTPECQVEMVEHRRSLLEDYHLSPGVVQSCSSEITKFCEEKLVDNGRTLHCLMEHSKPTTRKKKRVSEQCQRELELLVRETDAGEDWRVDPVLKEACQPVVDVACRQYTAGDGRVMSCLMDNVGSDHMTEDCSDKLLQIQYFISRDYRLDPRLYRNCKADAVKLCHAGENWADDLSKLGPSRGPLLPCLYRYAYHPTESQRLTVPCSQEVRRVMKQRAVSVGLHPEIEQACLDDLADKCLEKVNRGEELVCLQDHLEKLEPACQAAIGNYTEEEAGHLELNPTLYRACEPLARKFCDELLGRDTDQGDLMQCLLENKNDYSMRGNTKCKAVLDHFQLISLKDFRFSFKFKEACKKDVLDYCKNVRTKSEVVTCLSTYVRNDTLFEHKHRVSRECRQQLRVELLQRNEDIKLDPQLDEACEEDRAKYCAGITHGNAMVLECLKDHQKLLTPKCRHRIFSRQKEDMSDTNVDFALVTACKRMIKLFCDSDPADALACLKDNKHDPKFDPKCRSMVLKRMAQRNTDYRLNPDLRKSCSLDIQKFCAKVVQQQGGAADESYEGRVVECLKEKFQANRLRPACEEEIRKVVKEAQLDYHQDPILADACKGEIAKLCSEEGVPDADGLGQIEECLKVHFQNNKIENSLCRMQVAKLIHEGSADLHVDPVLFKSCALDDRTYCNTIPPGHGKHIKCLLDIARSNKGQLLQEDCRLMLKKRVEMYELAAKVAPPENMEDIVLQVASSPARNYFIVISIAIVGSIFIGGLFCGRVTKRMHYDMKRK